ncbi:MAG: peptidylprolyl isomerase [Planctomycetes bacterium]|nr:peptidylprolyl isomerase [Planctomycetota bacterium]
MIIRVLRLIPVGLVLVGAFACQSGPQLHEFDKDPPSARSRDDAPIVTAEAEPDATRRSAPLELRSGGPDFLAFPRGGDEIVARVGSEDLRKSQVYDYMMLTFPDKVRSAVAVMLSNRVIASEVARHGIRVDESEIDDWFEGHRKEIENRMRLEPNGGDSVDAWLRQNYGQGLDLYERVSRDRERSMRLLARLVRYHEVLEDRVQMRLISMTDRNQARQVRQMLDEGADFGSLAQRFSVHASAEAGGLMHPVWRLALNPALDSVAFELPVGATSPVVEARDADGRPRYQIVRVVERHRGQQRPYAEVEKDIELGLLDRPLTQDEGYMWQVKVERLADLRFDASGQP